MKYAHIFLPTQVDRKSRFFSIKLNISYLLLLIIFNSAVAQTEEVTSIAGGSSDHFIIWFSIGIIIFAGLFVFALTIWSKKQDDINNMMIFCIKYLMESVNETQKIEAARSLGSIKNHAALLILVDLINDEKVTDDLHKTAKEALKNLSEIYRGHGEMIEELISAEQESDHQRTIDILISKYEKHEAGYVQSAFVIGREYMRLNDYAQAREWLQKAKIRNAKAMVYVNQISERLDVCNNNLILEGDAFFESGDYQKTLERYALATHDMNYRDKQHFNAHLRLACVYSKLSHYEDAFQETLHALHDRHETDLSLKLNNLLKRQQADRKNSKILQDIDVYVTDVMQKMIATGSPVPRK